MPGSVNRRIVIHEQVFFSYKIPDNLWPSALVQDANILGRVNVAFNCSQSSNTIITNTSPDHQTYLPFRARTNKMRVVLFVVFSPNVNTVVCTEHNLTFISKYYFFSSSCLLSDLFALYTTWLAFFDSLPEPPFSFSLTFFYILPNATPFARFSGWKSLFCTRSALQ